MMSVGVPAAVNSPNDTLASYPGTVKASPPQKPRRGHLCPPLPPPSSASRVTAGASADVAEIRCLGFPGAWVKHSPPKRLRNASAVVASGKQNTKISNRINGGSRRHTARAQHRASRRTWQPALATGEGRSWSHPGAHSQRHLSGQDISRHVRGVTGRADCCERNYPGSALITVTNFARPGIEIEIQAVGVIGYVARMIIPAGRRRGQENGPEFVIFECGNGKSTIAPKRRLIGGIKHELATIA